MEKGAKILNFGSLNIDFVYKVPHLVQPGETISSAILSKYAGGKGANQSVALTLAGAHVAHAGKMGPDGVWLLQKLTSYGVNTRFLMYGEENTGHAIIQVDDKGQNAIIVYPGANKKILKSEIDDVLKYFEAGSLLLLQNEINQIPYLIESAHQKGMLICLNPSPMTEEVRSYPLHLLNILIVNETEAEALVGGGEKKEVLKKLAALLPKAEIIFTVGEQGVLYQHQNTHYTVPAVPSNVIDVTGAGDAFIGYFLAARQLGKNIEECLQIGCKAASICVSRLGAIDSLPKKEEVFQA